MSAIGIGISHVFTRSGNQQTYNGTSASGIPAGALFFINSNIPPGLLLTVPLKLGEN